MHFWRGVVNKREEVLEGRGIVKRGRNGRRRVISGREGN